MHLLAPADARRDGVRGICRPVGRPHRRRRRDSSRALVAFVVAAVNWGMKRQKQNEQALTMCVFVMDRSTVSFVILGDGLVASTKQLVFEGKLPVDGETKELLCIRNASRGEMKVQLIASEKETEGNVPRAAGRRYP